MKNRDREAFQNYLLDAPVDELFDCRELDAAPPEYARKFPSLTCEICGEAGAEHKMRLQEGKTVCLDCFKNYGRYVPGGNQ
jgi:formylmethanofuran dehydrogenase subunit E